MFRAAPESVAPLASERSLAGSPHGAPSALLISRATINALARRRELESSDARIPRATFIRNVVAGLDLKSYQRVHSGPDSAAIGRMDSTHGGVRAPMLVLHIGNDLLDIRRPGNDQQATIEAMRSTHELRQSQASRSRKPAPTLDFLRANVVPRNFIECRSVQQSEETSRDVVSRMYHLGANRTIRQLELGYRRETVDCPHPDTEQRVTLHFLFNAENGVVGVFHDRPETDEKIGRVLAHSKVSAYRQSGIDPDALARSIQHPAHEAPEAGPDAPGGPRDMLVLLRRAHRSPVAPLKTFDGHTIGTCWSSRMPAGSSVAEPVQLIVLIDSNGLIKAGRLFEAERMNELVQSLADVHASPHPAKRSAPVEARPGKLRSDQRSDAASDDTDRLALAVAREQLNRLEGGDARQVDAVIAVLTDAQRQQLSDSIRDDLNLTLAYPGVLSGPMSRMVQQRLQSLLAPSERH